MNITGGSHDVEIEHVAVGLVTRIEVDGDESDYDAVVEFHRAGVSGGLHHGMTMGLRTEVSIRGTVDKGDLDPVYVYPLPVQERILEAFTHLGFQFKGADLERGHIHGLHQSLPFYQEIEFYAGPQYPHGINEVEMTFVTDPHGVDVVLEFDKRGGLFTGGHDSYGRYRIDHGDADRIDWTSHVDGWLRQALEQHHALHASHGGYSGLPAPGYGHRDSGHGHHEEHHDRAAPAWVAFDAPVAALASVSENERAAR